jgi:uncharacterized protein YndB with AHSA1/START domain
LTATRFDLVSEWQLDAPVSRVWAEIVAPEQWPDWWRAVKRVEIIKAGDANGIGTVRRFTWATALPYSITFDMEVARIEPEHLIEARASGEFDGIGRWTVTPQGNGSHVKYEWLVELIRPWQRAIAPLLRPVFVWNHQVVLGWGEADLKKRLGLGA